MAIREKRTEVVFDREIYEFEDGGQLALGKVFFSLLQTPLRLATETRRQHNRRAACGGDHSWVDGWFELQLYQKRRTSPS